MDRIDFKALADALLDRSESLLAQWFPQGVQRGHEFTIGDVTGSPGDSLSINVTTGQWCDFGRPEHKGGDLISLYAASRGLSQLDAARELSGQAAKMLAVPPTSPKAARKPPKWSPVLPVPDDAPAPPDRFARNEGTSKTPKWVDGQFVRRWTYLDADGRTLGHVARFHWTDPSTGEIEKDVVPQTWCVDDAGNHKWRTRSFPVPRPLYGLRELAERPNAPVLIVEGEKSADAAREIAPQYVVITWPGGIEAWRKAALNPLRGHPSVLLWPDADEPGRKGMWEVGHALLALVPTVKIILPEGKPDGWDAADARAEGWGWREFKEWALPLAVLITETGAGNGKSNTRGPEAADPQGVGRAERAVDGRNAVHDADQRGPQGVARPDERANARSAGGADARSESDAASVGGAGEGASAVAGDAPEDVAARPDLLPPGDRESAGRDQRSAADAAGRRASAPADFRPAPRSGGGDAGGGEGQTRPAVGDHDGREGDRPAPAVRGQEDAGQAALSPAAGSAGAARGEAPAAQGTAVATAGEPQSQVARWLAWGLDRNGNGLPLTNLNNAVAILEHDPHLQGLVWFDEFLQRMLTSEPPREWGEADDVNLTLYMQRALGLQKMGVDTVRQAVKAVAYRNVRNCARDWMTSLKWDGVKRIEQFFPDVFGADDNRYTRAAGRNFWIGLAARVHQPGCQVDNMVVLEGTQGRGKSTAAGIIGGEWFAAQHESATNPRAFAEVLQGKMLVEIEEMDSFSRVETNSVKKAVSVRSDRFRPSGAHGYAKDHPRQCVFIGTTNRDDWNKDETGARRFWPIRCTMVELDLLRRQRELYFAEAVACYLAGESWWEMPEEETKAEQTERYDADPWLEPVAKFVGMMSSVTTNEVMQEALKIPVDKLSRSDQMRVATCLRVLGWSKRDGGKATRIGRKVVQVWYPPPMVATQGEVATEVATPKSLSPIPF